MNNTTNVLNFFKLMLSAIVFGLIGMELFINLPMNYSVLRIFQSKDLTLLLGGFLTLLFAGYMSLHINCPLWMTLAMLGCYVFYMYFFVKTGFQFNNELDLSKNRKVKVI